MPIGVASRLNLKYMYSRRVVARNKKWGVQNYLAMGLRAGSSRVLNI